jgi:hypothetical protein
MINLPLGCSSSSPRLSRCRSPGTPRALGSFDLPGAALATLAIAGLCIALIQASGGLTSAVIAAAAVSLTAATGFAVVERHSGHPMPPLEPFRSRQFAVASTPLYRSRAGRHHAAAIPDQEERISSPGRRSAGLPIREPTES